MTEEHGRCGSLCGPPSEAAVRASVAAAAKSSGSDAAILAVHAAHDDPALGLDRSVCLRDVVTWLEGRTGYGGSFTSADDVKDAIALHFGGPDAA